MAELRRTATEPEAPPSLREAAAARLARLSELTDVQGAPLVPAADPARWWGMARLTESARPVVGPDQPVRLSGSQLGGVLACPRHWFLAREARAESIRNAAATFGSVVHVLAEHGSARGTDGLSDHLDEVWDQLNFDARWLSAVERIEAESAVERFLAWQEQRADRELLGTEESFACDIDLGGERIHLTGTADRVERDPDGRIRIVDFKTGRSEPRAADVAVQDQLGAYQLAVAAGAFEAVAGRGARPGGAELVYLRLPDGGGPLPKVFGQASLDDVPFPLGAGADDDDPELVAQPTWVHRRLWQAARLIRSERFDARVGPTCRYCPFRGSCPAQAAGRQVVT